MTVAINRRGTSERRDRTSWRRDWQAAPGQATHKATGGLVPCALLLFACLNPLLTTYLGLPDVSGAEGALALVAWVFAILSSGRVYGIDAIVATLGVWAGASALVNGLPLAAAGLSFALLSAPFTFLRLAMFASQSGLERLAKTVRFLVAAQVVMMVIQYLTIDNIDALQGTFAGTLYGNHVASFLVLLAAGRLALNRPGTLYARLAVAAAMALALLADSKVALGLFLAAGLAYLIVGRTPPTATRSAAVGRSLLAIGAVGFSYAFYIGALGNIPLQDYFDQSRHTGGGKVAVTQLIADPGSDFWHGESYLFGAGPGQTVSRAADLATPNAYGDSPAARVGIPQSQYYGYFASRTTAYGYVSESSVTAAASSVLGILGDLGVVGILIYGSGFWYIWRWVGNSLKYRSWPAIVWLTFAIPGFLGEWLEFPAACMFLVGILVLSRQFDAHRHPSLGRLAKRDRT
jgi:hypothetical protein